MGEEGELFDCKQSAINEFLNINIEDIMEFCKRHFVLLSSVALTGVGFLALKQYTAGGVCTSKKRLTGKTVIITGANCGIGKETAKDLVKRGARVIIACRDITKAERAAESIKCSTGQSVIVKTLDLASLDSVRKFSENILKTEKNIDILINNAGVMGCPRWKSEDGYELQFATNHLGHFLLTNLLLDRIKQSAPSRIINVSSRRHTKGKIHFDDINLEKDYDPWKAYDQSKLANVLFTRELHKRLEGSRVSVFSLHPGVVSTNLASHLEARSLMVRLGLPVLKLLTFKDPVQGAQTTIHCAVANIEEDSGKYFSDCAVTEPAPQAKDDEAAKRLWELSEEMTKLVKKLDT